MPKQKPRRARKPRVDPVTRRATKLGDAIAHQTVNGSFEFTDIVNHTDAIRYATVAMELGYSTKEDEKRQTIRRMPKIVELKRRGVINERELAACIWYKAMHAARYDTLGVTLNYAHRVPGGRMNYCHGPKNKAQQEAFDHFDFAKDGINPFLVSLFERVVLHGRPLGRLTRSFRLAIAQLIERIEGRVQL